MNALSQFHRHLSWKFFLTYLIVILVSVIVMGTSASIVIPRAYTRYLSILLQIMGNSSPAELDLFSRFQAGVTESLAISILASLLVAVIVSILVSRQVVAPVREMMLASQRVADGHYDERVNVTGSISRDELDELGQLALSFNQMAARLERTENMRRQLIGDVAHELRTPLTTIKGSMEGLIDGVLPAEVGTFQQIHAEAVRMDRLVNDLQELSRIEAGAYELNRTPVQVADLVSVAVGRLGRQFDEKGVALEMSIPADLPEVWVDEGRTGQVLLNLIGNALQYTPMGGQVGISATGLGSEVEVSITDSGIGIPAEHIPLIFARFYRVDKSRSRAGGGTGIGLTIARHLVENHGGRIWATSPGPGKGSTFSFTLPVAKTSITAL